MANWDIRLGYKNLAYFNAHPNLVLKSGQHLYLSDTANAGQFKMGDGITTLALLSWYGGSADTYKVMATAADTTPNYLSSKILVGGIITKTVQNPGGNENILLSATETDPVFGAWLAGPPNVSIFTNDAGYVTGPAGVNTNIQYNDSSAFGGDNGFTYGKNTHIVTINNPLTVDGTYTATLKLTSNTAYTTSIINKLVKSGGNYSGGTYLCVTPGSGVDYTATGFLAVLTGNGGKFLTATNKDDTTKGTYFRIYDATGSVPEITLSADSSIFSFINCHLSIGKNSIPTAVLHLPAGTATASTAPLKLTSGTALAAIEDGALEYHSSHLYFSIGAVRYQLDQQAGGGAPAGVAGDLQMNNGSGGFAVAGLNYTAGTTTMIYTSTTKWRPTADGTTALQFLDAAGSVGTLIIDTTNNILNCGGHYSMRKTNYLTLDASATADTANDIRFYNNAGVLTFSKCTVPNATKYAGTWVGFSYLDSTFLGIGSLTDPGFNALMGWDDTDNALKMLAIGANLSYDHATHTLSATGGGGLTQTEVILLIESYGG